MDIDAYIIDYRNEKILYATRNSSFLMGNKLEDINAYGLRYYDKITFPETNITFSKITLVNILAKKQKYSLIFNYIKQLINSFLCYIYKTK